MTQAIKPDFFNNLPTLNQEQEEKSGVSDEERHLYRLSSHKGWKILLEYINDLRKDLDGLNDTAYEKGLPLEEIGRNAVIVSLTRGILKKITDRVEDAKEACENTDGTLKQ